MSEDRPDLEELITSEKEEDVIEPNLYKVLIHNDNYTTMEFVVEVLIYAFHKRVEEATRIMLNVHKQGVGICGTYPFEVAEKKVDTVHLLAREKGFPLKCSMEKE